MFLQQDLGNNILKIIEKYKILAHMLQIEIMESILNRDYHMIIAFIQRMHKQGIKFSLGGFGIGYPNISNVPSLPIRTIKIDKSLFWKAMVSTEGVVALRKMCEAFYGAYWLLPVEGVENEEQVVLVRDCACRYIRGYYYVTPFLQERVYKLLIQKQEEMSGQHLFFWRISVQVLLKRVV